MFRMCESARRLLLARATSVANLLAYDVRFYGGGLFMPKRTTRTLALEVGNRLRGWMKKHELTQESLAKQLSDAMGGVTRQTVTGWLSGKSASLPSASNVTRLATQMGLSPNYLLLGEGPPQLGVTRPAAELESDLRDRLIADMAAKSVATLEEAELAL